ncbi:hypothetical protein BDK51DRAFT_43929 [Blyttiomyces helicus]|uniref:S-adenosyl-L-methionine-dependent methyltransferase n=1 Tax=Blyttiomyces helicus TaxID=388810 RepID=A0A4P9WJY8_9FUNG|nr:hypothetical protein BDK51DRAFT_43929 [Blyttiomyces helicus]|eukprot:RKO92702.1 hypothetical protein BDK51DRAFT_43929 [Blyttiomyces helicus]
MSPDEDIVLCLSGRGDKDVLSVAEALPKFGPQIDWCVIRRGWICFEPNCMYFPLSGDAWGRTIEGKVVNHGSTGGIVTVRDSRETRPGAAAFSANETEFTMMKWARPTQKNSSPFLAMSAASMVRTRLLKYPFSCREPPHLIVYLRAGALNLARSNSSDLPDTAVLVRLCNLCLHFPRLRKPWFPSSAAPARWRLGRAARPAGGPGQVFDTYYHIFPGLRRGYFLDEVAPSAPPIEDPAPIVVPGVGPRVSDWVYVAWEGHKKTAFQKRRANPGSTGAHGVWAYRGSDILLSRCSPRTLYVTSHCGNVNPNCVEGFVRVCNGEASQLSSKGDVFFVSIFYDHLNGALMDIPLEYKRIAPAALMESFAAVSNPADRQRQLPCVFLPVSGDYMFPGMSVLCRPPSDSEDSPTASETITGRTRVYESGPLYDVFLIDDYKADPAGGRCAVVRRYLRASDLPFSPETEHAKFNELFLSDEASTHNLEDMKTWEKGFVVGPEDEDRQFNGSADETPEEAYQMIGNAVPPPLAYALGRALLRGWSAHVIEATKDPKSTAQADGAEALGAPVPQSFEEPSERQRARTPDSGLCSLSKRRLFFVFLAALLGLIQLTSRKNSVGLIPNLCERDGVEPREWGGCERRWMLARDRKGSQSIAASRYKSIGDGCQLNDREGRRGSSTCVTLNAHFRNCQELATYFKTLDGVILVDQRTSSGVAPIGDKSRLQMLMAVAAALHRIRA